MKTSIEKKLWTKDFIIACAICLMLFFGFQMLTPTLPVYVKKIGATDKSIGWVVGIFTISSVGIRPIVGIALDNWGRRGVLLIGLIIFIIAASAYSFVPTVALILLFRFIHGFGWGASNTAISTVASDLIPLSRFGEGMGYFSLASSIAMAVGPAVSLFLMEKYSFNIVVIVAVAVIILSVFLSFMISYKDVRPKNSSYKSVDSNVKNSTSSIGIGIESDKTEESLKQKSLIKKNKIIEKTSLRAAITIFFVCVTYGGINSFLTLFALEQGIENIGIFFTVYAVSMVISRPLIGKVIDTMGIKFAVIPGLLSVILAMGVISLSDSIGKFIIAAIVYGIGFGTAQSSLQTLAVINAPKDSVGAANATFFMGFDSGIGLGSVILGIVSSQFGYSNMFLFSGISVFIAFVLFFVLERFEPKTSENEI